MADDVVLGIDLGTTNSVVAVADSGHAQVLSDVDGKRLIPSVVSFPPGEVLVGDLARERRLSDAENTVYAMKRLIGRPFDSEEVRRAKERFAFDIIQADNGGVRVVARDETWALAEISAFVLRECRRIAEQVLDRECRRVVITVPANFNELQRSATKAAGTVAGLDVVRILNEPTAAAIAYGCGAEGAERVAVFDFGGGTFDMTVLELDGDIFEVVTTAGDTFLGGDDLDLLVTEEMAFAFERDTGVDPRGDRQAFERLRAAAEWVKCQLSFQEDCTANLEEVMVDEEGNKLPLAYRMTRKQLEDRVTPLIDRAMEVTAEAMKKAGIEVDDIDTVVLVGGTTRIPLVRSRVTAFFGKEPRVDIDPDLVVALGASVQGYALSNSRPRKTITVFPSAKKIAEVRAMQNAARAGRPDQPAFAPQNYGAQGPPTTGPQPTPSPAPEALSSPPVPLSLEELEEVSSGDSRPLSKKEIASALFSGSPSVRPGPPVLNPSGSLHVLGYGEESPDDVSALPQPDLDISSLDLPPPKGAGHTAPGLLDIEDFVLPTPGSSAAETQAGQGEDVEDEDELLILEVDVDGEDFDDLEDLVSVPPGPSAALAPDSPDLPSPPAANAGAMNAPVALAAAAAAATIAGDPPQSRLSSTDLFDSSEIDVGGLPPIFGGDEFVNPTEGASVIPMPGSAPPTLMDVTPFSLGIQTAGGYCEWVIRENTPIPIEQTRMFSTARDDQETVDIAVCQGESRVFGENQNLGEVELSGLPAGARGKVSIQVTFMLDADGTLDVNATDEATGQLQKIRINLVGGYDDEELRGMRERQEAEAAES
ncbi:MAG: Hsp70 family protein [Deltaproteobacteria bacterium]|nr:Hsp70 family protein [Deltaproteobacteria bacterium]